MLKTYIAIALRNLRRHKKYTAINLGALTLGLVPVILLLLYVQYELGFDRYHERADRIYRVAVEVDRTLGRDYKSLSMPSPLAQTMVDKMPEVVTAMRLMPGRRRELAYGHNRFVEWNLIYADAEIFDIFSFELVKGDPKTALKEPQTIIISEEMVEKYFGDEEPVGKVLTMDGYRDLKVTGVLKRIPKQSHFLVDFLVPVDLVSPLRSGVAKSAGISDPNSWNFSRFLVYFLVREGIDIQELEKKFPKFLETYTPRRIDKRVRYFFQALTDIHLHSHFLFEMRPNGDIKTVYLYASLALVILLIACISFINLATIRSAERAREVGVRKVIGARRGQLMVQFLGEATVLTLFATTLALMTVALILPAFNAFVGREIELSALHGSGFLQWLFGLVALVSLCSGSYPALVLSGFKPVKVLQGKLGSGKPSRFRMSMAVAQLVLAMLFIVAALVIREQMQFARQKDLGYRKDHIVTVPLIDRQVRKHLNAIKTELRRHPNILAVSSSSSVPNDNFYFTTYQKVTGEKGSVTMDFHRMAVDHDFIALFEMEIVEGRNFSPDFASDVSEALIVNETAVRAAGWKSPLSKEIGYDGQLTGRVIGVVKDFHRASMHEIIPPLFLRLSPEETHRALSVKLGAGSIQETLSFIDATIRKIYPDYEFKYAFYDDLFDAQYKAEQKLARLFNLFATLAIAVACIGLFGLVSLATEQRRKEIGIRKVFGASAARISALLTQDFAKWVLLASLLAWPLAWYGADKWLQTFAYRVELNWETFLFASAFLFAIVLLTVGYQAFHAASMNPVDSLRYE